ncbi:patatin-like phospholipase family protein [Sphingorhabdus sp. Alg239-R122]|uniref:patatin-like phospholipase family protein n=1 Tax=Sphingorhabdus sp. Alg239-R122 TaxID=2305989 RepID=UPI0013DB2B6B|nr:patatin-like phospholipase family protein [Sphingorhabdus sp. Alg239-R122]
MAGGLAAVLSGGGARGAFQVGVLDELITNRGVRFDIFAGVSTGAIQALGGAMNDMPALLDQWLSIKRNSDIYRKRPLGAASALFGSDSLYNAKAIKKKIKDFADPEKLRRSRRKLRVGVVNLTTGDYVDIDEKNPNIGDWVYASSAQPPFFQPLKTSDGAKWVDGGVRDIAPLSSAMKLKPRALLVILASPREAPIVPGKTYDDLVEIGLRSVEILTGEIARSDVGNAMLINDLLAARGMQLRKLMDTGLSGEQIAQVLAPLDTQLARYNFAPVQIIEPAPEVAFSDALDFKPSRIRAAIEAGRQAVTDQWPSLRLFLQV